MIDHYTPEHVEKTRKYSLDKKNFGIVKQGVAFVEGLLTLWYQILPVMWVWSKSLVAKANPEWAQSEIVVSVAFVLLTSVISAFKDLPWGLYHTFVIEERHGFNKQTLALYFTDMIKSVRHLPCNAVHIKHGVQKIAAAGFFIKLVPNHSGNF